MSDEYDSLIEGYPGLDDPDNDPGPLTDEENQRLEEELVPAAAIAQGAELDEPPHEPDDWPEDDQVMSDAAVAIEEQIPLRLGELRALRPDQQPVVGHHYVIFQGVPRPVQRSSVITEDEHARTIGNIPDPARAQRADRSLRLRYRGYLCGEIASL